MKTVCDVLGVARSNVAIRTRAPLAKPLGRPPQPETDLLAEIKAVIGDMPTYGYRQSLGCSAAGGRSSEPPSSQPQAYLSGHESPPPAAATSCRRR